MTKGIKVLVTGGTGFLASHIVQQLLEQGYQVRTTVRNPSDRRKCAHLLGLQEKGLPLELCPADLLRAEDWPEAVKGCEYVLHVASPVVVDDKGLEDPETIFYRPAIEGTMHVLRASARAGVKRVVLTGSISSIVSSRKEIVQSGKKPADETMWAGEDTNPYARSKILAEHKAWDFIGTPEAGSLELTVLLPVVCLGPPLNGNMSESAMLAIKPMLGRVPLVPDIEMPAVDVRDAAAAHILAMTNPKAANQRYLLCAEMVKYRDYLKPMVPRFNRLGYYLVSVLPLPTWFAMIIAPLNKDMRHVAFSFGVRWGLDNSKAIRDLGLTYRDTRKAFLEMAVGCVTMGLVRKTKAFDKHAHKLFKGLVPPPPQDGTLKPAVSTSSQ